MIGRRGEPGFALVVVLWAVAALSLIAGAMLASAVNTAHIGRNAWTQLKVQTAADAGVQSAILSLFNPGPNGLSFLDGREQAITFDGAAVSVSVQDELGRIDLNYAGRELLRDYFRAVGADDSDADTLADRVVDWRSPKGTSSLNGATSDDYARAGYGYRPRGAPFQSVDELRLVMGMTPELFRRAAPGLTVYSHSNSFDTRFAPADVLMVVPGMDWHRTEVTIAARAPATAQPGHTFAVVAVATQGRMRFSRRAAVLISGNPARPYWVLDWK